MGPVLSHDLFGSCDHGRVTPTRFRSIITVMNNWGATYPRDTGEGFQIVLNKRVEPQMISHREDGILGHPYEEGNQSTKIDTESVNHT